MAKFSDSYKDSETKKKKNRSNNFKECEDNGKKRHMNSSLYCSHHGENNSQTSGYCKVLKSRASDKDNPKDGKGGYKKKFKELNIFQVEAAHQKYRYEKLSKDLTKKKTSNEDNVVLYDSLDSDSSSSSSSDNSFNEFGKTLIGY